MTPQDHYATREAVLARSRAISHDPQDYARRLAALDAALNHPSAYRRSIDTQAWAVGAEHAAKRAAKLVDNGSENAL